MSYASLSSSGCRSCEERDEIINKQKDKLATVEFRLRDCVRAYKTVLNEKNVILQNLEASKELYAKRSEQEEKRLAALEDNLNELSSICGKYEAENMKNQALIEKLNQRCDELTQQLVSCQPESSYRSGKYDDSTLDIDSSRTNFTETTPKLSNKWTQTVDLKVEKENLKSAKLKVPTCNQETQTNIEPVNISYQSKQRKTECAIVLPTHRDLEMDMPAATIDSRHGSHGSRGSDTETVSTETDFNLIDSESNRFESVRPSLGSVNSMINQEIPGNSVSLFYVNELARKEIELVESRLAARENECALRELRWKYNVDTFKLQSKITRLEQQLQQIQNDDTTKPNLTYARNVLTRFLKTKDKKQKTCMMIALLTALGVDQKEVKI